MDWYRCSVGFLIWCFKKFIGWVLCNVDTSRYWFIFSLSGVWTNTDPGREKRNFLFASFLICLGLKIIDFFFYLFFFSFLYMKRSVGFWYFRIRTIGYPKQYLCASFLFFILFYYVFQKKKITKSSKPVIRDLIGQRHHLFYHPAFAARPLSFYIYIYAYHDLITGRSCQIWLGPWSMCHIGSSSWIRTHGISSS